MPRNMSFMLTTDQIRNQSKTVTRRTGWLFLKGGDILNAVEKGQGLKKGEKVKHLCKIQVIRTQRERLNYINQEECGREGFPEMTPDQFVEMFCKANKCEPTAIITRISFEYLEEEPTIWK